MAIVDAKRGVVRRSRNGLCMTSDAWGIDLEYEDAFCRSRTAPPSTIDAIRRAMGAEGPRDETAPRSIVLRRGDAREMEPGELTLEDGTSLSIIDRLPPDVPLGYHVFRPRGRHDPIWLIVSPGACALPSARRNWAWAVQLYAARSEASWGIGDLADLRELAVWSKGLGAGMLLINPLHAVAPVLPQEPSPYFPTSRRFRNPIYLRIEEIPGAQGAEVAELAAAARALNRTRLIDRDEVFRLKRRALAQLFARFEGDREFDAYIAEMGDSLSTFSTYCALAEEHGRDYRNWPLSFRHPRAAPVCEYRRRHAARVRFHSWLQWHLDRQLAAAAREIAIVQDLAVGIDPGGADAWSWQDLLAADMSIGAPPDLHNPWGQDWGLPPFIPHKLEQCGFAPFVDTIRAALRHAGGLRMDHAMGLFRLFWIPRGARSDAGTFVNYPAQALLDIVALESHRAGALIVAEDLGTVQQSMRDEFIRRQMLSYRLLWLEDDSPPEFPRLSLAAVTTHDLYTIAGLWTGSDLRAQREIGLNPHAESVQSVINHIRRLANLASDAPLEEVVIKIHRLLAEARSLIVASTLDDALLVVERPNMPGTTDQWPNWRLALPLAIEEIKSRPLPRQIAQILGRTAAS